MYKLTEFQYGGGGAADADAALDSSVVEEVDEGRAGSCFGLEWVGHLNPT